MRVTKKSLSDDSLRVRPEAARAALQAVLGLQVTEAVVRLRRGPGACPPLARLMDTATEPDLCVVAAAVGPGEDMVRIRRRAHGHADWIMSPTSNVVVTLGPAPAAQAVGELPAPAPEPPVLKAWERTLAPTETAVLERLCEVLDPELGVNIVDLGFVRDVVVSAQRVATITMTLTTPTCPLTSIMTDQIRAALFGAAPAVDDFRVDWVWAPSWRPADLSPDGVAQLQAIGIDPVAR